MKRKKTWLCVCLTLLMLTLSPAAVYGGEPEGDAADKTLVEKTVLNDPVFFKLGFSKLFGIFGRNFSAVDVYKRQTSHSS